jgi:hypothetical protein
MSDKEKELNNKPTDDRQSSDLKIEFKPSDSKDPSFVVKKTPEQIKIENSESVPEQSSLDINANLGSFGTPEPIVDKTLSTTNISALEKIQEKNDEIAITDDKDSKINFNKFENRQEKKSRTKFGARFDIWLRKPKILLRI